MDETAGSPLNPPVVPEGSGKSGAWTPGPWKVSWESRAKDDWDPDDPPYDVTAADQNLIVDSINATDRTEEENAANLDLIAAAPELYEALEVAVRALEAFYSAPIVCPQVEGMRMDPAYTVGRAEAALLKANPLRKSDHEYGPHAGGPPHAG